MPDVRQPARLPRPRGLCLVVDAPGSLNDTIFPAVRNLRTSGWSIHILSTATQRQDITAHARQARAADVPYSTLDDWTLPPAFAVRPLFGAQADRSDRVRHALEQLVQVSPVGIIAFATAGGLAFRTVQARRAGLAFVNVPLVVTLDTCAAWQREQQQLWPTDLEDLAIDHAERYAFEHADMQLVCSSAMKDYVHRLGWTVPTTFEQANDPQIWETLSGRDSIVPPTANPLVTIAIPHYNLGHHLPATLDSVVNQTYWNLEIFVIDDGSTDPDSLRVLALLRSRYPQVRFLSQTNSGIGATRNRGLAEAQGSYFLPMDADNIARPDMVERLVTCLELQPHLAAATCYFLAFTNGEPVEPSSFRYAYRPTGGPHTLASIRNIYGDANALFRTAALRSVGGFETDRDTSFEDWEVFVKLIHAGLEVDVLPDHLFYYRHLESGYSRITDSYRNHRRVLRQFLHFDHVPASERAVLWLALHGFQRQLAALSARHQTLPHRLADAVIRCCLPLKRGVHSLSRLLTRLTRRPRVNPIS
jgi:glycosyltransferase involved in cell wall biosynthesis